jgi:uncharacterized repeat protein (TIGR02543 family)
LVIVTLIASLFATLGVWAPRASGGPVPPRLAGDGGSGWISDVAVVAAPAQAEGNASLTTAANGSLYMAFETGLSGTRDIYFTSSSDAGLTWTVPVAVADTGSEEVSPSITQDPFSGRTFIAYARGNSGATPIHAAYSDDLVIWNDRVVLSCGVICVRPRIVSEYWNGTNNLVYVALSGRISANDWNTAVARSLDHGDSWSYYESGLSASDVRYHPDLAVQKGADGVDRVFMFYRGGATFPGTTGYAEWSENHGATWGTRGAWINNVDTPISVVAAHDGSSLLFAYGTAPPQIVWGQVPNPQDLSSFTGTWSSLPTAGTQPALAVDGTGTTSTSVQGSYHMVAHDAVGSLFHVTAPVTLTSNADWSAPQTFSDTGAVPSGTSVELTVTSQDRGGVWYPAAAWTDARAGTEDVYYTTQGSTPGLRVTLDTIPTGRSVTLDGTTRIAPAVFSVSAGLHTVSVASPQSGAAGWRYLFSGWSDGGPISHVINVTADTSLIADFSTQVQLTLISAVGGTTGDGWYDLNSVATITATSPIPGGAGTRSAFSGWTGDLVSTVLVESVTMDAPKTITANWRTQVELTLISPYGGVTGGGWYDQGANVMILVTSPQTGSPGTRYAFAAWTGDIVTTISLATSVTMDAPKTITANWQTQYYLTADTTHGNVTGSGWYAAGTRVMVQVPSTEVTDGGKVWDFTGWTGDATGTDAAANVTMSGPQTVVANWRERTSGLAIDTGIFLFVLIAILAGVLLLVGLLLRRRKRTIPAVPPMSAPTFAPPGGSPGQPIPSQAGPPNPPAGPPS